MASRAALKVAHSHGIMTQVKDAGARARIVSDETSHDVAAQPQRANHWNTHSLFFTKTKTEFVSTVSATCFCVSRIVF
jgi:hypothetical protein